MANFSTFYYLALSSTWNSSLPPPHFLPPALMKLQCHLWPAEGAAHLCNPCHSSAAGPGLLGRYTGSCQEC